MYVARKFDNIDHALAKYLNGLGAKLKISFLRESEGVYRFGSKRVVLVLDKGGEDILIRVGGGFMHIKQFVD